MLRCYERGQTSTVDAWSVASDEAATLLVYINSLSAAIDHDHNYAQTADARATRPTFVNWFHTLSGMQHMLPHYSIFCDQKVV